MKRRLLLTLAALPVLAIGYCVYHPGIAYAETPLARGLVATSFGQEGNWNVDAMHTCIGFDVGHLGLSRVQGRFGKVSGTLHTDPADVAKSSVKITIDASSVDTAVAPRDADLRSTNFFDVAKYPTLTFTSTSVTKSDTGYTAVGDLTLHGVTKPVTIEFEHHGAIKDPWGNTRMGVVAQPLVLHRSDYGMTFDADSVSDDVTIRLSLEATLAK